MRRLHGLIERLTAAPDLEAALEEILIATLEITGAEMGNVQLADPDDPSVLRIVAQRGFGPDFLRHFETVRAEDDSACGRALRTRERVVIEDAQTDSAFGPHRAVADEADYRSVQSTPLVGRSGEVLGILSTHYPDPGRPSERDLRVLDLYSAQAADQIARRRTAAALDEERERKAFLLDLGDALRPLDDPREIRRTAARMLGEQLEVDRAFHAEWHARGEPARVHDDYLGPGVDPLEGPLRRDDWPTLARRLGEGRTVSLADVVEEGELPRRERVVLRRAGIRAQVLVPLVHGGRLVGAFGLAQATPRAWSSQEIDLVQTTAERIWTALDRARSEQETTRRRELVETLLERAPLGVYLVDADFRLAYVNPAARPLFEAVAELIGRDFAEVARSLWGAATAHEVVKHLRGALETGASHHERERAEYHVDRGEVEYYDWRVEPVTLADGRPGAACYFRDVSNDVQARAAIAASEARYRTLFESIDEGFCVVDLIFDDEARCVDYRYVEANPAFQKHTGLPDPSGRRASEIAAPEPDWLETFARVARTGEPVRFQNYAESTGRWFDVYAFRLGDAPSRRVAILFTNITERKRFERHREESDRRKDEFLATLAHELRNPLAAIRMGAAVLATVGHDERFQDRVTAIERQAGTMARLIDDLVDVSRITRGRVELRTKPMDLAPVISQAADTVRSMCERKDLELDVDLPRGPITIDGDPVRMAQVLSNLLDNACKFTPPGGRVRLAARPRGDAAVIHVEDTGVGIDPEDRERIFEMFAQAGKGSGGGLGLGLPLVRSLVRMHGGEVEVESEPGVGSRFVVTLPVRGEGKGADPRGFRTGASAGAASTGTGPAAARRTGAHEPSRSKPVELLVVDDNADALEAVASFMRARGHRVRVAASGEEALELVEQGPPEAMIVDIGLPGIDGYEVARTVRRASWGDDVMLVALTGWGRWRDEERSRSAGFDHHVTKPAEPETLRRLIEDRPAPRS